MATCSYINVLCTVTENRISVITVESCLKPKFIWTVMFVFTLVWSCTRVDTVQNVLHGLTNSRYICWSHTMKELGWRVISVRRNLSSVAILIHIYFDTVYVCSEYPKRFCTAAELMRHQLSKSDYEQFYCGLCGNSFRRKASVNTVHLQFYF